jgi:hypothetical protein
MIFFAKANDGPNDKIEPSTVQGHGGILTIRGCVAHPRITVQVLRSLDKARKIIGCEN